MPDTRSANILQASSIASLQSAICYRRINALLDSANRFRLGAADEPAAGMGGGAVPGAVPGWAGGAGAANAQQRACSGTDTRHNRIGAEYCDGRSTGAASAAQ